MPDQDVIIAYARTASVSTRCRLCGERNPADMPVVRIENPMSSKVATRYYCMACYRTLRRVALKYIPNLTEAETGKQAGHQLAVLLGVETGRAPVDGMDYETQPIPPVSGADSSAKLVKRDVSINIELRFPAEHILNRVPFEKFYEEARRERALG